jgi:uncharacterized protein (TIGR02145 family)
MKTLIKNIFTVDTIKRLFTFGVLTLSLNVTSIYSVDQFNKNAYLNLNQKYNFNHQVVTKEKNAFDTLFAEIFSSVRNELGSTDSDNIDQLGNRIANNLENKAINQGVHKTEQFINKTANEFFNKTVKDFFNNGKFFNSGDFFNSESFGSGKSNVSITLSDNPSYRIQTIQPLTRLTEDSTKLTFIQAQLNTGNNNSGDTRSAFNIGVGHRLLLERGRSIAGVNLFNDYEPYSGHQRISLGLEYQRANFAANFNKYFAVSNKMAIDGHTEEALSGFDVKVSGQVPYLPWAKIKASGYVWDKTDSKDSEDISGVILGVEAQLNPSLSVEIGIEDNSAIDAGTYARLNAQIPFKNGKFTNFNISKKMFSNSGIVKLTDLNTVARSSKIRIEKIIDGDDVISGVYNAATTGAQCTLYNASNVAIENGSGQTTSNGSITFHNLIMSKGLVSIKCIGGSYVDEATGKTVNPAPTLNAATIYSGTGDLSLIVSPLSEIAYQLAGGRGDDDLEDYINDKNKQVAEAFGMKDIDIIATIPTDVNNTIAKDDNPGKFGLILAVISQMNENAGNSVSAGNASIIEALINDIADGNIDGINEVDVIVAISNFKNSEGANNNTDGTGFNNVNNVALKTGENTMMGDLAIAKIDNFDGVNNAPTLTDYINASADRVVADNIISINAHMVDYDVNTTSKIQTRVSAGIIGKSEAVTKISNYESTSDPLTVQDYIYASIYGVNESNLIHMNDEFSMLSRSATDANYKIQNIVNEILESDFYINDIPNVIIYENNRFTGNRPSITGVGDGVITYSLSGDDANYFNIVPETGIVTDAIDFDFEYPKDANANNIYKIIIVATDTKGNFDSEAQDITILNTAQEEAVFYIEDIVQSLTPENSVFNSSEMHLTGDDPTGYITYTLEGVDAQSLLIDSETGIISMVERNFEIPADDNADNNYEITVIATDVVNNRATRDYVITVSNIVEVAHFTIDPIASVEVLEGVEFIGEAPELISTDEIDDVTFSLEGVDREAFTIESKTGVVHMVSRSLDAPVDVNTDNIYEITIVATDPDGNTDSEVQNITITLEGIVMGTQTWSKNNMALIPHTEHHDINVDYWRDSLNDTSFYYTWNAAVNVCPTGWVLPSDNDWKILEGHLGMSSSDQDRVGWRGSNEGTFLKSKGDSGFDAALLGFYSSNGEFYGRDEIAYFWTSSEPITDDNSAYRRNFSYGISQTYRSTIDKKFGFNVRCLKL